jgi:hypothetical protein
LSGTTGTSGLSGTTGTSGLSGTTGTSGLSGTTGTSGRSGTDGTSGRSGTDGTSGRSGTDGTSGRSGTTGTSGLSSTSGTSGLSGTNGTSGLSGTNGTSGRSGTDGTSGRSGTDGTSGRSGTTGTSGLSSTSGTSGLSGTNGTSGLSGTTGTSGRSGTDGTSGRSGTDGTSGRSGTTGTSGLSGTSGSSGFTNTLSGTSGTSASGGVTGTAGTAAGSTPYLAYWRSNSEIDSTKAPGNLGFYFDSGSGNKYAINSNSASNAALSIFSLTSLPFGFTPPVVGAIGTTLLTQVNQMNNNQYDLATSFVHYYSGTSTNIGSQSTPNINLITSKLTTTGGVNPSFIFHPNNQGDYATNTTSRKVIISDRGIRSGFINLGGTNVEAGNALMGLTNIHFHAGSNANSSENGVIAWDGRTSGTLAITVPSVFTSWTMTLPGTPGSSGQFLQTDGAGVTSWTASAAGGLSGGVSPYFTRWASGTTLSGTSSLFFDTNYGSLTAIVSTNDIVITKGTSQPGGIYFVNSTTGTASSNGFAVGITGTGIAQLRQYENLALETYTNNTKVMTISGSASFGYGKYHDLFRVNETQWAPWEWRKTFTGGGAVGEVWSQTTVPTFTTVPKSTRVGRVVLGTQSNSTVTGTLEVFTTGSNSGRITIPINTILFYEITAMCYQGVSVGHQVKSGAIGNRGGTVANIGTLPAATTITAFPANTSWTTAADNTNKSLNITVTTTAALNVRWLFVVDYYEIGI